MVVVGVTVDGSDTVTVERIVVATGKAPVVDGLGLEHLGLDPDDDLTIEITDNGVGIQQQAIGFGLTIVQLLCQQLKAKWETTDAEPGTRVVVLLPVNGAH